MPLNDKNLDDTYNSGWDSYPELSFHAAGLRAVAEAAVKAERVTASHWQSLYEAQVALNETMHRREIRNEAAVKDAVGGDEPVATLSCGEIGPNGEQEEFEIDCEYGALERFTSQHPGKKFKLYTSPQASAAVPEGYVLVDADALIRWRSAFSEELSAYDIEPPLHHVKTSHDEIDALLKAGVRDEINQN